MNKEQQIEEMRKNIFDYVGSKGQKKVYVLGNGTAKAILQAFYKEFVRYACANDYYTSGDIEGKINDLAKEYDVEVER